MTYALARALLSAVSSVTYLACISGARADTYKGVFMLIRGFCAPPAVPHWGPDCTEFTVSVNICGNRGYQSTVPMPIVERLGRPTHITFRVRGDEIVVTRGPEGLAGPQAPQAHGRRQRRQRATAVGAAGNRGMAAVPPGMRSADLNTHAAAACAVFARTDERAATSALADSLAGHERYASGRTEYAVGSRLDATVRMYSETALAVRSLYSSAFSGRGAGGGLHRAAISSICAAMRAHHHYAVPDLGDSARTRPDVVVHSFRPAAGRPTAREAAARRAAARRASEAAARLAGRRRTAGIRRADAARRAGEGDAGEEGGGDAGDAGADAAAAAAAGPPYEPPRAAMPGGRLADPDAWSDEVIAVEVEASPSKHRKQVLANYEKAASAGMSA